MSSTTKTLSIDFLIPRAYKGGVETVTNSTALYLQSQGYTVRIIQVMPTGILWADPKLPLYYLCNENENLMIYEVSERLVQFLSASYASDVLIAVEWPALCRICRQAIDALDATTMIIAAPHSSVKIYEQNGAGGPNDIQLADAAFVLNRRTLDLVKKVLPEGRVAHVYDPVCCDNLPFRTDRNGFHLAFVGRLSKHIEVVLDAMVLVKNTPWTLDVVGDDGDIASLTAFCEANGIVDRVTFWGWQEKPWSCIPHATLHISASDFEALMLTGIESLLCGIPVLSTPTDGVLDYITPGKNGFLFPFGDSVALSEILEAITSGILPLPDSYACRESAIKYRKETALLDYEQKLLLLYSDHIHSNIHTGGQ